MSTVQCEEMYISQILSDNLGDFLKGLNLRSDCICYFFGRCVKNKLKVFKSGLGKFLR